MGNHLGFSPKTLSLGKMQFGQNAGLYMFKPALRKSSSKSSPRTPADLPEKCPQVNKLVASPQSTFLVLIPAHRVTAHTPSSLELTVSSLY